MPPEEIARSNYLEEILDLENLKRMNVNFHVNIRSRHYKSAKRSIDGLIDWFEKEFEKRKMAWKIMTNGNPW